MYFQDCKLMQEYYFKINKKKAHIKTLWKVKKLLSHSKNNHIWLNSVGKMVLSLINNNLILEDIILFKKFVKGGEILDFGTGSGYNALLLAQNGFKVKGVDVDNYNKYEKNIYNKLMTQDQKKKNINKLLLYTHLKYFSHHLRIVSTVKK